MKNTFSNSATPLNYEKRLLTFSSNSFKEKIINIFIETKKLVKNEQSYTKQILRNLLIIERDKLYSELKYPTLFNYLTKELKYSDTEAIIRVNAVRIMLKSKTAKNNFENDKLTLSNAAEANRALMKSVDRSSQMIDKIVQKASTCSKREFKEFVQRDIEKRLTLNLKLDEHILIMFDRIRKKYQDTSLTYYEIIHILLEKELKFPDQMQRSRNVKAKNSRSIPKSVKIKVFNEQCANCGTRYNLEYDHKIKFSHGGKIDSKNIQILCRNCNQRKEIKARQLNFFA